MAHTRIATSAPVALTMARRKAIPVDSRCIDGVQA